MSTPEIRQTDQLTKRGLIQPDQLTLYTRGISQPGQLATRGLIQVYQLATRGWTQPDQLTTPEIRQPDWLNTRGICQHDQPLRLIIYGFVNLISWYQADLSIRSVEIMWVSQPDQLISPWFVNLINFILIYTAWSAVFVYCIDLLYNCTTWSTVAILI